MDLTPHRRNRMERLADYKIFDALTSFCRPLPDDMPKYTSYDGLSDEQLKPEYDAMEVVRPGHPQHRFLEKMKKRRDDDDEYDRRLAKMRKYRDDDDEYDRRLAKMRKYRDDEDQYDGAASKVVLLTQMLSSDDHIEDDDFYRDFLQDVTKSARKYGNLVRVVIPRPSPGGAPVVAGIGRVFLEYSLLESSTRCRMMMHRGIWAEKQIVAVVYPEDKFAAGDYGYEGP